MTAVSCSYRENCSSKVRLRTFLKANELAQGSKTLGRKPSIFTIEFTFFGCHGKQLLHWKSNAEKKVGKKNLEKKVKKNGEKKKTKRDKILKRKVRKCTNNTKYYTIIQWSHVLHLNYVQQNLVLWDLLSIFHITYLRFSQMRQTAWSPRSSWVAESERVHQQCLWTHCQNQGNAHIKNKVNKYLEADRVYSWGIKIISTVTLLFTCICFSDSHIWYNIQQEWFFTYQWYNH